MKFNKLTFNIAIGILGITAIYTLVYSGLAGLLLCSAVTLIAAGFIEQFEIVASVAVVFSLFYTLLLKNWLRRLEPFDNLDTPQSILGRLSKMENGYKPVEQSLKDKRREPYGVYDPAVEGFEDVSTDTTQGAPSESSSAPTEKTGTDQVDKSLADSVTSNIDKKEEKKSEEQEFQSATNNLFKIGKMPSENMDGPKLDSGSTLMKAMSSFKPEQVSSMTKDTKQLLETQKGLMEMLTNMRPVLQDGKELLQTFSGMFGGAGGGFKLA